MTTGPRVQVDLGFSPVFGFCSTIPANPGATIAIEFHGLPCQRF